MHRFHLLCDVINNMKLFRIFSVLPSLFFAAACAAGLSHIDNCEVGCPTGGSDQTLVREAYTLNNNSHRKFANWVAYKITKASLASRRSRSWKRDPDLPATDTLAPAAYKGASAALAVDRGHQAPLACRPRPRWSFPAATGRLFLSDPVRIKANTRRFCWIRRRPKAPVFVIIK